jgi:gluconolactonase
MSHNPGRYDSSSPIRYPDPDIKVIDPRFQHMVLAHAAIERIADRTVRFADGRLVEDRPNATRLAPSEVSW